jgi:hypothetical protein
MLLVFFCTFVSSCTYTSSAAYKPGINLIPESVALDYLNKQKKILDDEGNNTWGSSGKCVFNDNYASSKNKKLRYIDSKTDTWTAVGFVYVDLRERGQDGGMSFCTLMFNKDDKKNIDKTISAFVSLGSLYSPGL